MPYLAHADLTLPAVKVTEDDEDELRARLSILVGEGPPPIGSDDESEEQEAAPVSVCETALPPLAALSPRSKLWEELRVAKEDERRLRAAYEAEVARGADLRASLEVQAGAETFPDWTSWRCFTTKRFAEAVKRTARSGLVTAMICQNCNGHTHPNLLREARMWMPLRAYVEVAEFDGLLQLEHSVRSGDVAAVKSFIRTQQGEFLKIANRPVDNLLSLGLQSYRRLDMVKELIQGRCSANSVTEDGRSPLHWAVSEVDSISPIVTRLLLCSRADHLQRDNRQLTPVDCLKSRAARPDVSSNVKQIMSELLEHPTQQVAVIEKERVLSACFADASCETVAFHTDSAVGFYSLRSAEVTMRKVLSKPKAKSGLRGMAVHRARGTLAVLVELTGNTPAKEMVIVWPRGQLEDEEPLQWCVQDDSSGTSAGSMPSMIAMSRLGDSPVVACRGRGGQTMAWRLHPSGAQLDAEMVLVDEGGGAMALSCHGRWLALEESGGLKVWALAGNSPEAVACLKRRSCSAIAVAETPDSGTCLLAIAGGSEGHVEVLRVQADGYEMVWRVPPNTNSNFRILSFCDEDSGSLVAVQEDGLIMLSKLSESASTCIFDDSALRTVDTSPDKRLMVTTIDNCFRVFKVC
ncbi:unnamed protein product [Effrenium voratum]|nr:unnamed protein product [Effrenium voratum]